jgi:glycosyltransferase involved in cell wall biosynthesis
MFSKISVLIPTRYRINRLRTLIASFEATTDGAAELVFRVDDDDYETQNFLIGYPKIIGPRQNGYESLPQFFNEMVSAAIGDVFMCGNDDMVFKTPGWPQTVLDVANRYPDGVFDIGVKALNETHFPFSIVSRKAVDAMGYLWHPTIFWGDIFLRDVNMTLTRAIRLLSVEIDHDWAGSHPDQTFVEGNAQRFMSRGPEYWGAVHQPAVNEAVERLRGLL